MRRVQVVAGEFIVHAKYGVAQFLGLKMRADKEDPTKKVQYMFLKYADGTATSRRRWMRRTTTTTRRAPERGPS
jgi:hypothetical protein